MKKKYAVVIIGSLFSLVSVIFNWVYIDRINDKISKLEEEIAETRFRSERSSFRVFTSKQLRFQFYITEAIREILRYSSDTEKVLKENENYKAVFRGLNLQSASYRFERVNDAITSTFTGGVFNPDSVLLDSVRNLAYSYFEQTDEWGYSRNPSIISSVDSISNKKLKLSTNQLSGRNRLIAKNIKEIHRLKDKASRTKSISLLLQVIGLVLIFLKDIFE